MMRNDQLTKIFPRRVLLLSALLLTVVVIAGCSKKDNPALNNTQDIIEKNQEFAGGTFEEGDGTSASRWSAANICGTAPCAQRINSGNNIEGYSWDMRAAANNAWDELLTRRIPELNNPSTSYTLEFDFSCVTATTSDGWNMAFRDADHPCCIDAAGEGTAYYANGTTAKKQMQTFTCFAGEKGHYVVTFTTPTQKNTDYYWRLWDYGTTTNDQEMVIDNFNVYKTANPKT